MEVGEEGDYIPNRYSVTTRMTPALRWEATRAILMFHNHEEQTRAILMFHNCEEQSHKTMSTDHKF